MKNMEDNNIILSTSNLDIGYYQVKKTVQNNINIKAFKGELIGLIGRNGVGKSTLLRTLAGLQKPMNGEVIIKGKDIKTYKRTGLAKLLGFVSTEHINVNNMKVSDLVSLGRFPHTNWLGKLNKNDKYIVHESISMVGLDEYKNANLNEISDGEKQRVMIARSLAQDTDIIILDEPSAFLDVSNKYEVVNILNDLTRIKNKTVIFSSHDLNIAIQGSDKLWLMLPEKTMEGAPEDFILDQDMNSLFSIKNMNFDYDLGVFIMDRKKNGIISLTGDGHEYLWTKKAMERLGFEVAKTGQDCPGVIIETNEGTKKWIYRAGQEECVYNDLYSLCKKLRALLTEKGI